MNLHLVKSEIVLGHLGELLEALEEFSGDVNEDLWLWEVFLLEIVSDINGFLESFTVQSLSELVEIFVNFIN